MYAGHTACSGAVGLPPYKAADRSAVSKAYKQKVSRLCLQPIPVLCTLSPAAANSRYRSLLGPLSNLHRRSRSTPTSREVTPRNSSSWPRPTSSCRRGSTHF